MQEKIKKKKFNEKAKKIIVIGTSVILTTGFIMFLVQDKIAHDQKEKLEIQYTYVKLDAINEISLENEYIKVDHISQLPNSYSGNLFVKAVHDVSDNSNKYYYQINNPNNNNLIVNYGAWSNWSNWEVLDESEHLETINEINNTNNIIYRFMVDENYSKYKGADAICEPKVLVSYSIRDTLNILAIDEYQNTRKNNL